MTEAIEMRQESTTEYGWARCRNSASKLRDGGFTFAEGLPPPPSYGWCGTIGAFCENFRLIGALLQVEVVFGFSAKSWYLMMVNYLRSQNFIAIFRTKCNVYKIWGRFVSNCSPFLNKKSRFFLKLLQPRFCISILRVDITQRTYAPFFSFYYLHFFVCHTIVYYFVICCCAVRRFSVQAEERRLVKPSQLPVYDEEEEPK